ncbi:MAG: nitrogen fixation protein NifH [Spirochaetes bacterium]|nr:nitrogen fixation protein NifH [Spirochaetota bacterium]
MVERGDRPGEEVFEWLLEEENPSVRYFTLTGLLGKPESDTDVVRARKAIMRGGVVPRILGMRNDDGYWGAPGEFYTDKYGGTTWQLLILAEFGADGADAGIRKACESILDRSQERESRGFSFRESVKTGGGLPSGVIPCLTGNMVYSLLRLGHGGDPRVEAAIGWICDHQRFDDGVPDPPRGEPYDRYEMCWGRHSCHMGVVKALKAFTAIPARERSAKVKTTIAEGAEYLLAHRIHKRSHDLASVSRPGWLKFGFPLMYQTDILEILWILAELGVSDGRTGEALDIVRDARGKDGKWKMANSFNGKMLVDVEEKGKPSKWITLRALRVLGVQYGNI